MLTKWLNIDVTASWKKLHNAVNLAVQKTSKFEATYKFCVNVHMLCLAM